MFLSRTNGQSNDHFQALLNIIFPDLPLYCPPLRAGSQVECWYKTSVWPRSSAAQMFRHWFQSNQLKVCCQRQTNKDGWNTIIYLIGSYSPAIIGLSADFVSQSSFDTRAEFEHSLITTWQLVLNHNETRTYTDTGFLLKSIEIFLRAQSDCYFQVEQQAIK